MQTASSTSSWRPVRLTRRKETRLPLLPRVVTLDSRRRAFETFTYIVIETGHAEILFETSEPSIPDIGAIEEAEQIQDCEERQHISVNPAKQLLDSFGIEHAFRAMLDHLRGHHLDRGWVVFGIRDTHEAVVGDGFFCKTRPSTAARDEMY